MLLTEGEIDGDR